MTYDDVDKALRKNVPEFTAAIDEHIATYLDDFIDGTCMLPAGHEGPHEFTPDDQIEVTFKELD